MSCEDSRQTIASICSTLSFFCEDSILELENFSNSKDNLLHSSNIKTNSDEIFEKISNMENINCQYRSDYNRLCSNCFCQERKNDKFDINYNQEDIIINNFSTSIREFSFEGEFIKTKVKEIICLLLDESKTMSILQDDRFFYEFQFEKKKDQEIFTQVFKFLPEKDSERIELSDLHDSILMDKFMFGEILGDILLITQYISSRKSNSNIVTQFDASSNPSISVRDYMMRLAEFFLCSPSLFVLMFIYIKRILDNNPSYVFDSTNAHRLMLATLVLSVKLYDDKLLSNSHYAHVGGVSEAELSRLEVDALKLINFKLKVTSEEFIQFSYSIKLIGYLLRRSNF